MERVPPPPDVWVDPRVAVGPSGIEGYGLYAIDDIPAGEMVLRMGGRLMTTDELEAWIAHNDADPDGHFVDSLTIYEDAHLVLPPMTNGHYGNHSCEPTIWMTRPYEFTARRGLLPGDELTLDYGTISGADRFVMECRCRTASCRGSVTSDDWLLPELRERYGDHWPPAMLERFAAESR